MEGLLLKKIWWTFLSQVGSHSSLRDGRLVAGIGISSSECEHVSSFSNSEIISFLVSFVAGGMICRFWVLRRQFCGVVGFFIGYSFWGLAESFLAFILTTKSIILKMLNLKSMIESLRMNAEQVVRDSKFV